MVSLLVISIFPMIYIFIKNHKEKTKTKIIYYLGLLILFLSLILIPFSIVYVIGYWCTGFISTPAVILLSLGGVQAFTMNIIWFARLYFSFHLSARKLTKCTIAYFVVFFISNAIIVVVLIYDFSIAGASSTFSALLQLFGFINLIIAISISSIFAVKLYKMFKGKRATNTKLFVSAINKSFICTLLSLFVTMAATTAIIFGLVPTDTSIAANYFGFVMIVMDGYTNCLFVMLSFKGFDKWYHMLLGCIDSQFGKCWQHKINQENLSGVKVVDMTTTENETTNDVTTTSIGDTCTDPKISDNSDVTPKISANAS